MNILKYTLLIISIYTSFNLFAQQRPGGGQYAGEPEGVVYGTVVEAKTGKPVEFANIVIYSFRDSTIVSGGITNKNGEFNIDKVRYGKFFVEIQFIGFGKQTIPEVIIRPDRKVVNLGSIALAFDTEILEEVTVDASRERIEYRLDRRIVNVSQDIISAGGTAVEALENVPGVQTDLDGNVSLRGTESFLVLIDGRPSPVQGSEALQQIPAETIESIEIITNPSARYDSEGVGGIINIIMKKDRRVGYNAQISANIGTFGAFGTDFLINIRKEKFNFFIGGNYNDGKHKGSSLDQRISFLPNDEDYYLTTKADRRRIRNSGSARVGMDYYINDKEILTVSGRYNLFVYGNKLLSTATSFIDNNGDIYNNYNYLTDNFFETNWSYFSGDVNYLKKFTKPGHEIQIYASYATNMRNEENKFSEQEIDYLFQPVDDIIDSTRTFQIADGNTLDGKFDYVLPISEKSKLEAGYQIRISRLFNDYKFQNLLINSWVDDSSKYNTYDFIQNVQSGYLVFSNLGEKFGFMTGIRSEFTDREFNPSQMDTTWKYKVLDFFPSMHISYKLPGNIDLMASYSRRLDRPRPWYLDPFVNVVDPNNVRVGNPMLESEYTNSFEINVQKRFNNNFVSLETYYRGTNNQIERFITVDPVNPEIFISSFQNIGQSINAGIDLMTNLNFTKWWNFNISGSGFYYEIVDINSTFSWNARLNNSFRFTKYGTSVQLTGFYRGESITSQGKRLPMYMMGAGVRQDLFDRKLTVSLNVRDVFNTMGWEVISETPYFYSHSKRAPRGRTFTLSITYRINDFQSRRERGFENGGMDRDEGGI